MNRQANIVLLMLLLSSTTGCISSSGTDSSDAIGVVVSIPPYAEWVEQVGGEYVDVTILVPEGASPHTYEITPQQMVRVSKASLWVKNGVGLEQWADKIVKTNDDIIVVDISSGVSLIGDTDDDERYDAHVWLSLQAARAGVSMIANALIGIDPEHAAYYESRAETYRSSLFGLEQSIATAVGESDSRTFLVFHPAWAYFARDFGLIQIAIEDEGKEPGPEYLSSVVNTARELGIAVVFIEPQFSPDDANVIADEIGGTVVSINPLAKSYLANMGSVAQSIIEGLA